MCWSSGARKDFDAGTRLRVTQDSQLCGRCERVSGVGATVTGNAIPMHSAVTEGQKAVNEQLEATGQQLSQAADKAVTQARERAAKTAKSAQKGGGGTQRRTQC